MIVRYDNKRITKGGNYMKIKSAICLILALTLLTAASCGKNGSVSTASDAEQRQNDETLQANPSPSDSSRSYTTQDRQFSVSIKSGKTGKTYTVSDEDARYIGSIVTSSPRGDMLFNGNRDFTITVDGEEYYYDSEMGQLGNSSILNLYGDAKEEFESVIKKYTGDGEITDMAREKTSLTKKAAEESAPAADKSTTINPSSIRTLPGHIEAEVFVSEIHGDVSPGLKDEDAKIIKNQIDKINKYHLWGDSYDDLPDVIIRYADGKQYSYNSADGILTDTDADKTYVLPEKDRITFNKTISKYITLGRLDTDEKAGNGLSMEFEYYGNGKGKIIFTQSTKEGKPKGDLYTGADYTIEKFDGRKWKEVPTKSGEPVTWIAIAYILKTDSVWEKEIDFSDIYGELSPGEYRIVKSVYDNGKSEKYYATFTVK